MKREGRWGTQEKWARHCRVVNPDDSLPSTLMVPAAHGANPSRASKTEDLPAPEGPTNAIRAAGRRVEAEGVQGGGGAVVVLDAESLYAQIDRSSRLCRRRGSRLARHRRPTDSTWRRLGLDRPVSRQGEDVEHPGRRRLPFRAGVEFGPGAAERDEDFRGDQEHGERRVQAELAPEQAQAQDHGHETDAESGDEVHGQGRKERHPQRPHGGDADPFGGLDDLTASVPVAPEGSQRGKSLNELEEPPGQRPEAAPLPRRAPVGLPPEVDHGHGDREHQGHHDDQGEPVLRGDPDQQNQRHHCGHDRLGEIAGEVGVERTQAARGGEGQLTGAFPGQPGGPEGEHLAQELSLQRGHDRVGRATRPVLAEKGEDGPGRHRQRDDDELGTDRRQRSVMEE